MMTSKINNNLLVNIILSPQAIYIYIYEFYEISFTLVNKIEKKTTCK